MWLYRVYDVQDNDQTQYFSKRRDAIEYYLNSKSTRSVDKILIEPHLFGDLDGNNKWRNLLLSVLNREGFISEFVEVKKGAWEE